MASGSFLVCPNWLARRGHCTVMSMFLRRPVGSARQKAPSLGKVCQRRSTGKWQHVYHVLAISGQDYGRQWLFQMSSLILHNFSLFSGKIFANIKKKLFVPLCIFMGTVSLNYFIHYLFIIYFASLFWHLGNPEYGPWPHPAECLVSEKILNQVIIQITRDFFCDELCQGRALAHSEADLAVVPHPLS